MCLILLSYRTDPALPLVVAANRDEFYDRATRSAQFWPEAPTLMAGKDLVAGGTWMGMTRTGRFAAITNYRDGGRQTPNNVLSRGLLTTEFLLGHSSAEAYAQQILKRGDAFGGFNLLVGDQHQLVYCNNIDFDLSILSPGYYGLSNHLLNTPWPKVTQGVASLEQVLKLQSNDRRNDFRPLGAKLRALLANPRAAADVELPETGISIDREKILSPIFIETPQYGTCCSTTLIQTNTQQIFFSEKSHYPDNQALFETEFALSI